MVILVFNKYLHSHLSLKDTFKELNYIEISSEGHYSKLNLNMV